MSTSQTCAIDEIDPAADYLIRARVAHDKDPWNGGDAIRMRIGERGSTSVIWVARSLILPIGKLKCG